MGTENKEQKMTKIHIIHHCGTCPNCKEGLVWDAKYKTFAIGFRCEFPFSNSHKNQKVYPNTLPPNWCPRPDYEVKLLSGQ